jgi:hypothetical protein
MREARKKEREDRKMRKQGVRNKKYIKQDKWKGRNKGGR